MFEYAISCGKGTLLAYGVEHGELLNLLLPAIGGLALAGNGDFHLQEANGSKYTEQVYSFRPASQDCQTGK